VYKVKCNTSPGFLRDLLIQFANPKSSLDITPVKSDICIILERAHRLLAAAMTSPKKTRLDHSSSFPQDLKNLFKWYSSVLKEHQEEKYLEDTERADLGKRAQEKKEIEVKDNTDNGGEVGQCGDGWFGYFSGLNPISEHRIQLSPDVISNVIKDAVERQEP